MAKELDGFLAEPRRLDELLGEFARLTLAMERRIGRRLYQDLLALYFSPRRAELRLWPDHPVGARLSAEFERARERGELDREADPASSVILFLLGFYALMLTRNRNAARARMVEQLVATTARAARPLEER